LGLVFKITPQTKIIMELQFIENIDEMLVIDVDKIGSQNSTEFSTWLAKNIGRIRFGQLPSPFCTRDHLLLNLSDLRTAIEQSNWLQENSNFICFAKSYNYIENLHKIKNDPTQLTFIDNKILSKDKISLSVTEMLALMTDFNLDSFNYEKYLIFEIKSNALILTLSNSYDGTKDCYSFPFLRSILINNKETDFDKCIFHFVETNINGKTIAMRVDFSNNKTQIHYDYSHNPPNGKAWGGIIEKKDNSF
jgi:hypothetical protein